MRQVLVKSPSTAAFLGRLFRVQDTPPLSPLTRSATPEERRWSVAPWQSLDDGEGVVKGDDARRGVNNGEARDIAEALACRRCSPSGRDVMGAGEGQDASTEQFDAGAPVHLPSQGLQPINVAFHGPITPRLADGPFHGAEIVTERADKPLQRVDVRGERPPHPATQRGDRAVAQDRTKLNTRRRIRVKPGHCCFNTSTAAACRSLSSGRGCPSSAAAIWGERCRTRTMGVSVATGVSRLTETGSRHTANSLASPE